MTMKTITEVEAMKSQLTALATPKPEIIRRLADATLGWPYVFGAWGEPCTPANRKRRARSDHPTIKSRCPALNGKSCADCQWGIGVRQYDCRGYTRWLLQQVGLDIVNSKGQACQTVTNQYNAKNNWIRRGPIKEMPNVVCCVFDLKNGHTGMHVGDGEIRHCSVNVQTGSTSQARWTNYAIPKGLYREEEIPMTQVLPPTLRQGMAGDNVKRMQEILIDKVRLSGIPRIIVTMGEQGAVYADIRGESGVCPALRVDVVDTTGAGDAFFAGVAIGLTYGKTVGEACVIGTRLAASVITSRENVCPRFRPEEFGIDVKTE